MLSSFSHQLRKSALWRYRVKFRSDIRKRFEQGSPVQGVHFEMLHFLPYGPMRSSTSWTLEGRSFDVRFPHFMAQNHVKRLEIDDGGGLISCRNINTFESSRFIYIYICTHLRLFSPYSCQFLFSKSPDNRTSLVDSCRTPTRRRRKRTRTAWLFDRTTTPTMGPDSNTTRPPATASGPGRRCRRTEPVRVPLCRSRSKPGICPRWSATIPTTAPPKHDDNRLNGPTTWRYFATAIIYHTMCRIILA